MKKLCYQTLDEQGYKGYLLRDAPERILQFGEGNFLRAFVDHFVDVMNERAGFNAKVVLVQPASRNAERADVFNGQNGLYTLYLRGMSGGAKVSDKRVISCVSRCLNPYRDYSELLEFAAEPELRFIVSNTTEAGIIFDSACSFDDAPPTSFPAKLTRFLYERFEHGLPGFVILSCELIDNNGQALKEAVRQYAELWELPVAFGAWLECENIFCSTLVDRIVTGYPQAEAENLNRENGYEDALLDTGELFAFWAIEGPANLAEELPFEKAGLPVLITDDHTPYKQRKVRILNGAHTSMVLAAYLAGHDIVRECMNDPVIAGFMNKAVREEIIPTLTLPRGELDKFASDVTDRFRNPFIDHALLSIALNSVSKWRTRVLPSLLTYREKRGALPRCLTFSLAALIAFYHAGQERSGDALLGKRGAESFSIKDEPWVLDFFMEHRQDDNDTLARAVCANQRMWGQSLSQIAGLAEAVAQGLDEIQNVGAAQALKNCQ